MKFIVEKGFDDGVYKVDISKITFTNPIGVYLNFDCSKPPIALCDLIKEDNFIFAEVDSLKDEYLDLYPAIGIMKNNDTSIAKITSISLCSTNNVDKSIKTIREQLNK